MSTASSSNRASHRFLSLGAGKCIAAYAHVMRTPTSSKELLSRVKPEQPTCTLARHHRSSKLRFSTSQRIRQTRMALTVDPDLRSFHEDDEKGPLEISELEATTSGLTRTSPDDSHGFGAGKRPCFLLSNHVKSLLIFGLHLTLFRAR